MDIALNIGKKKKERKNIKKIQRTFIQPQSPDAHIIAL